MGPYQRTPFSKSRSSMLELLDTKVSSGSVKRGSDRWRFLGVTLPETNIAIAPKNKPFLKERLVFQPSIFRCYVSFREGK